MRKVEKVEKGGKVETERWKGGNGQFEPRNRGSSAGKVETELERWKKGGKCYFLLSLGFLN